MKAKSFENITDSWERHVVAGTKGCAEKNQEGRPKKLRGKRG